MTFNRDIHHRRSIRLRGYDYAQAGAYFVTICAQGRECLFGDVVEGEMRLNRHGHIVQEVWDDLVHHYPHVDLDAFVIMPNHIHEIIQITNENGVEALLAAPSSRVVGTNENKGAARRKKTKHDS